MCLQHTVLYQSRERLTEKKEMIVIMGCIKPQQSEGIVAYANAVVKAKVTVEESWHMHMQQFCKVKHLFSICEALQLQAGGHVLSLPAQMPQHINKISIRTRRTSLA